MCGIVGYIGDAEAAGFLLDGMEKLEYRGYDSAGIAVFDGSHIRVEKSVGRLDELKQKIAGNMPVGSVGIGQSSSASSTTGPATSACSAGVSGAGAWPSPENSAPAR